MNDWEYEVHLLRLKVAALEAEIAFLRAEAKTL